VHFNPEDSINMKPRAMIAFNDDTRFGAHLPRGLEVTAQAAG